MTEFVRGDVKVLKYYLLISLVVEIVSLLLRFSACSLVNTERNYYYIHYTTQCGRSIAEAVSRWLPPRRPGSGKWNLWWTKWRPVRSSPSTSVSPAKTVHSSNFSNLTITLGRHAEALRRADHPSKESC
jgi:hypothetical protein